MNSLWKKLIFKISRLKKWIKIFPFILFPILSLITVFIWNHVNQLNQQKAWTIFNQESSEIKERIRSRLQEHEKLLSSGVGLFNTLGTVSRSQWRQFITALELDQNHPGIQGIGFSVWLKKSEVPENIKRIRAEGFPEYNIKTSGNLEYVTSIIYLEPFNWRNQRAFGYDMYSESIRQEAMNEALQKGTAAITKKITLLQETETEKQNGFLMYLPVYNIGSLQNSDKARKKALKGFVYSPIRMNDFIAATIEKNHPLIQMEIYDGDDQDQSKNLLYRSPSFNLQFHEDKNESNGKYFLETEFKIFNNHIWHFHFKSTPAFEASISTQNSFIILIIGLILSFLITYIIYNFTKTRENALQLFLQKSQELRLTETTYRALHDYSPIGIIQLNSQFQIMSVNAAFELFIGYSENELKGMTLSTISHPDDIEISLKSANALFNGSNKISKIKKRFIHKNGKTVWSIVSSKIINYDHEKGPMFLSNVEDITESFNSEINLKKTQNQQQRIS